MLLTLSTKHQRSFHTTHSLHLSLHTPHHMTEKANTPSHTLTNYTMDISKLGLPTTATARPRDNPRSTQTSGSKHPRGMSPAEYKALLSDLRLTTIDEESVKHVTNTMDLHKNLKNIKISDSLYHLGYLCFDRFSDLPRKEPNIIYGPDLTCILVSQAVQYGLAQLSPDEQNRISNTGTFLQDSSNSPSNVITWLAKSLVEDPILLHGPMVSKESRSACKSAGLEIYSLCALCHYQSSIRAQIKPKLLPFPARNANKPHPLASRFVGVETKLQGHYQQPLTVLSPDVQEKQNLSFYTALHKLIYHTQYFLYNKVSAPIPSRNDQCYFFYEAVSDDITRFYNPEEYPLEIDDDDDIATSTTLANTKATRASSDSESEHEDEESTGSTPADITITPQIAGEQVENAAHIANDPVITPAKTIAQNQATITEQSESQ